MSREAIFEALCMAHSAGWERGQGLVRNSQHVEWQRFYTWRMAWWDEICRNFPDFCIAITTPNGETRWVRRSSLSATSPRATPWFTGSGRPQPSSPQSGLSPAAHQCMHTSHAPPSKP